MIEAPAFLADRRRRSSLLPHLALAAVTVLAGVLDFWALRGYGNDYYAAAVRSMLQSWHNLFYASFDPAGFVSVDKPPVAFWIETLSAKVFGFSGLSVLAPSAVAGAVSVLVLGRTVMRTWGTASGLVAALVLALTPVALVVNRSNNPDGILVLELVLAAWAGTRALESGRLRWVILTGVLMGLAFETKMLAAYLVLPGLAVAYLLAAPRSWPVRLGHVGLAGALTVVLSAAWLLAVDLTPASQRPWVGSSQDNSEISLATGYNGLQRILGG
ncbi:MAG: glycosyltransferase family 39 protein, partial [Candidatus Dormibacteraeota bacterium]|nr:glycosyltransferase family 39 protein [Candidatus Dormibacteraeota bacterium]MBO0761368.1 glycosyltransferase family 39 protein [Candidatus Dormibacteraeota bacterium]